LAINVILSFVGRCCIPSEYQSFYILMTILAQTAITFSSVLGRGFARFTAVSISLRTNCKGHGNCRALFLVRPAGRTH